jgi:hypothetical protein
MSPRFSYVVILQLKAASPVIGLTDASEAAMILVAWYLYSVLISSASADSSVGGAGGSIKEYRCVACKLSLRVLVLSAGCAASGSASHTPSLVK